jgi:hypothetical protein
MKYYIKIITGFREDQQHTIPMQEAHKAYYLFKNPEQRGVFENGVALIGKNIQEIRPDWNATMGWNQSHEIKEDDWNQIRGTGVEDKMKTLIESARVIGDGINSNPTLLKEKLSVLIEAMPKNNLLE